MIARDRTTVPLPLRALVLALAAAPRAWAAVADQGLFWPDEFYQSLEQAHRFAFGYGIVPWEFVDGLRSWVFPGAIGLLWKGLAMAGVTGAPALIVAAKMAMVLLGLVGVDAAMRLAARLAPRESANAAAALAGVFVGAFPALVFFGSKCMSEIASAPLVLVAALGVLRAPDDAPPRRPVARLVGAGALASLAIFLRFQNGLVAVGLLAILLSERRWRDAARYAAGATAVGLAGGLLDWVTWGRPFHAFLAYVGFHAGNQSAAWGTAPATYYVRYTWFSAGPAVLLVLLGFAAIAPRARRYALLVAAYVVAHSAVPHKEYRFLVPILPLFLALAAAGLASLLERLRPARVPLARAAAAAGLLSLVGFGERAARMTFRDLGHGDGLAAGLASGRDRPWHAAEGINRLLWAAGAAPDACGVLIKDIPWSSTGGFAYLHKDVPLFFRFSPRHLASANYLIARREFQHPWQYEEGPEHGGFRLFRREGTCAPPPSDYTRLVPP